MPRIQFKHIKRLEEIPPPEPKPVPSVSPVRSPVQVPPGARVFGSREMWPSIERDMMTGWHSMRVSWHIMNHEPESSWRTYVYDHACATGYQGSMHSFFCRDVQETADGDSEGVRFTWRDTPSRGSRDAYEW